MSKLTRIYIEKALEAQKKEIEGYRHAKLQHVDLLQSMAADDILELAKGLVLAISKTEPGDALFRAIGMARFYREFAASKRAAA